MSIFDSIINGAASLVGKAQGTVQRAQQQRQTGPQVMNLQRPPGLALGMGVSTGALNAMGHAQGLVPNQFVWLANDDACQNIVVFGGIGAGKTTRVINPLLFQLMGYGDVGGLIFDIKGDFCESVSAFANWQGRSYVKIGVGDDCTGTNLLKGLTPEQAAGFLQSTFYLTGGTTNESFWITSATALIQNTLGLLEPLGDKYYTLEKLYQYIFFEDVRKAIDMMIEDEVHFEDGTIEARNLANYKGYYNNVFMAMDIKLRESIKAQLSTILSPFQNPELIDAFSGAGDGENYDLSNILAGQIVLVDLPLAKWATAGKVVYTMIKLRFFNLLQARQVDKSMPQNFCFFMADEYQNIISASNMGLSDLSFWDKSRSAHCVGIISTQSISAFKSAIGQQTLSDTILANFRQKIFFKTEDETTLRYINGLAGRVEVTRQSYSRTSGESQQPGHFFGSTNNSSTYNTQIVERQLIDPNFMRQLSGNLALCFFNVEGDSADDVLAFRPLYPNDIRGFLGQ